MNFLSPLRDYISRFGVYGDYPVRLQRWLVIQTPFFVEPLLVAGWAAIFFILCRPARRGIIANLNILFPNSRPGLNLVRAYQVIREFAVSITDAARLRQGEEILEWEIEGRDHLDSLMSGTGGAVLLTAHMGNYDLAASLFANHSTRRIHTVRAPERYAAAQKARQEALQAGSTENLTIRYNDGESLLGIDLVRALEAGEIVAIQGDRVLFDVTPLPVSLPGGHCMQVPKGPFVLASAARCPIYPLIICRTGYRRYRVVANEPFRCGRGRGEAREEAVRTAAARWVDDLLPVIRCHWAQWFVFEPAFTASESFPRQ